MRQFLSAVRALRASILALCVGAVFGLGGCREDKAQADDAPIPAQPAQAPASPAPVPAPAFAPIRREPASLTQTAAGCKGEECPKVEAKWLRFPDDPALTAAVERELVRLAQPVSPDQAAPAQQTIADYAADLLADAQPRTQAILSAEVAREHGRLLSLDLSGYTYTGGAHGNTNSAYFNYDREGKRRIALGDVLLPGQEARFWKAAEKAHRQWIDGLEDVDPAQWLKDWPFARTDDFLPADQGLQLRYGSYAIAPYSEGQPTLLIAYSELEGVLRPEWLAAVR